MAKPLLGVMCRVTHCAHQKGRKSRLSFLQLAARESSLRGNLQGKLQISPNSSLGQQTTSSLETWGVPQETQCCEQRLPWETAKCQVQQLGDKSALRGGSFGRT